MTPGLTPASRTMGLVKRLHRPLDEPAGARQERIMAAMVQTVAETGLSSATLTAVARRAGVSSRSYRAAFPTIEAGLIATFEHQMQTTYARLVSSYRAPASEDLSDLGRLEAALGTLMGLIAASQPAARLCVVEMRGGGPDALSSHDRAMAYLAGLLRSVTAEIGISPQISRALIGGIWHVIHDRLVHERAGELPDLVGDLVIWVAQYVDRPSAQQHPEHVAKRPVARTQSPDIFEALDQRDRLLRATAALTRAYGYPALTTRAIADRANCSPTTFYRHFSSKQDAVLAIYDKWMTETMPADMTFGYSDNIDPRMIRAALLRIVSSLEGDPDSAYVAMVAIFALGATGRERREETIRHIARLFGNALAGNRGVSTVGLEATIGALWEILYSRALEHSTLDPSAQLVFVALAPFLGAERARAIAEAPLRGD